MNAAFHTADGGICRFRPLTGRDEADLVAHPGGAEAQAHWLVTRLLDRDASTCAPLDDFTITEFDDLLHYLLKMLVGETTICRAACASCRTDFEFKLDLDQLRSVLRDAADEIRVEDNVAYISQTGRRFRIPRMRDMALLHSDGAEAWLRGLLLAGKYTPEMEVEVARAAPVLAQDVVAPCPNCNATNTVRFDISDYTMTALRRDAGFLWREVHLIARTYGWALDDILSLSREVRRELAGLVVSDSTRLRAAS